MLKKPNTKLGNQRQPTPFKLIYVSLTQQEKVLFHLVANPDSEVRCSGKVNKVLL